MPQLDIDLFDDFLFFAFASLLFGFGDDETEELVIEIHGEARLVNYYKKTKALWILSLNAATRFTNATRVCINGKWPAFQAENMGSIPIIRNDEENYIFYWRTN